MNTKEAYKQKIEGGLELAMAKVAELKAYTKIATADARITYAKQVEELEHKVDATKARLKSLSEASDEAWEQLKDGVESAWDVMSVAVKDAATTMKR